MAEVEIAPSDEAHRESVRQRIRENASFTRDYVVMNTLATVIGAFGLLTNSPAVAIGAMVVAMLIGPITGMALALVDADNRLLRFALAAELAGTAIVVSVAFLVGLLHRDLPATAEMLARTEPNLFNLEIALAAGAAGAYATVSRSQSAQLVGVAISAALMLPLATGGLLLARGSFALAGGAFLLYLTNFVAIQGASAAVLWLRGYRNLLHGAGNWGEEVLHGSASIVLLLALGIGFGADLERVLSDQLYESRVRAELARDVAAYPGAYLSDVQLHEQGGATIVTAIVYTPALFTPEQVKALAQYVAPPARGAAMELRVRSVLTTETTSSGNVAPEATP
jgi:uncharacterized hydrophobic protein (TIGR00271 family)